MARGFAAFTDNHVQQAVVDGLLAARWDVVRAIDVFPERTADAVLLEHAAKEGRVFVTNDEDLLAIAAAWLEGGRLFPGLVYWHEDDYAAMTTGDVLRAFEALARKVPSPIRSASSLRPELGLSAGSASSGLGLEDAGDRTTVRTACGATAWRRLRGERAREVPCGVRRGGADASPRPPRPDRHPRAESPGRWCCTTGRACP